MILRRGVFTVLIQLIQVVSLSGITILVTRVTGAHGRGVYALVSLVAILASMVASLGVSWASIYFIGRRAFPLDSVVSTLLTTCAVTAAASMSIVGAAYIALRASYFHEVAADQAILMVILTGVLQVASATAWIVLGMNRPLHYAGLSALQVVTAFFLQAALALAGRLTASSALVALLAGAVVAASLGLAVIHRETPLRMGVDVKLLRAFFNFGVRGYAADLMMLASSRLGSLVVNGIRGVASLGYYSVATAIAETLTYGAYGLALVMFPHVSSLERPEANRIAPVVCRNVVFMTLVSVVAVFAAARELLLVVFGPAMLPAVVPLWLLLPGVVALSAIRIISSYLNGIGKPIYVTYIAGGSLVLSVALNLLLIPPYGISGAAIATTIVYLAGSLAALLIFRVESGAGLLETLVVRPDDFARYRRLVGSGAGWLRRARSSPSAESGSVSAATSPGERGREAPPSTDAGRS